MIVFFFSCILCCFVRGFFRSLRQSSDRRSSGRYREAFEAGKRALSEVKRQVPGPDGELADVPYFEMKDPADYPSGLTPSGSYAAGVPELYDAEAPKGLSCQSTPSMSGGGGSAAAATRAVVSMGVAEEEDEAMQMALALSMEEARGGGGAGAGSTPAEPAVVAAAEAAEGEAVDEEEREMREAIALSLS